MKCCTPQVRSQPTRIIGERFHIYASRKKVSPPIVSDNLEIRQPPEWILELAAQIKLIPAEMELPVGVIVGSAVILKCERIEESAKEDGGSRMEDGEASAAPSSTCGEHILHPPSSSSASPAMYRWHLAGVERAKTLRKPKGHPRLD